MSFRFMPLRAIAIAVACFISVLSVPNSAFAEKVTLHTTQLKADSDDEVREAVTQIQDDLRDAQASNPDLKPAIVIVDPGRVKSRLHRLSLAIIRATVSAVTVGWTLSMSPDVSFAEGLLAGLLPGAFSFGGQLALEKIQNFISGSPSLLGKCLRWLAIEVPFVTLISLGMTLTGHGDAVRSIGETALQIAFTATLGLGSQGIWDIAFVEKRDEELKDPSPSVKERAQQVSELKSLVVAAISAAAATLTFGNTREGYIIMGVMGAAGLGKVIYQRVTAKKKEACNDLL